MIQDSNCQLCPLHKTAKNVCIPGRWIGTPSVGGITIVGEAPGAQEDIAGRPFVGASGDELHPKLAVLGISNYYVTNVVRCFPRGTPTTTHVAACKPYLRDELAEVRPGYILALGNTAWHQFGKGPITEHAGKEVWNNDYGAWVMPALHPAAILRDPNKRGTWVRDLERFGRLTRGELLSTPPVDIVRLGGPTVEAASTLVWEAEQSRSFTFDFEAIPIPWWHRDWRPISVAFSFSPDKAYVVWLDGEDRCAPNGHIGREFFARLRPTMLDPTISKTAHNMIYDDLVWTRLAGYQPFTTFDTMVAAQLLDENRPKGLKYLGRSLLGWPQWDVEIRKQFAFPRGGVGTYELLMPREAVENYNGYDTGATFLLRELFLSQLQQEPRLLDYMQRLEMPKLRALERLMLRGIAVDTDRIQRHLEASECAQGWHRTYIQAENPGSSQQVAKWLFATPVEPLAGTTPPTATASGTSLAFIPVKLTDGGKPSTDEESIKRLVQQYPEHAGIRHLLGYRHEAKNQSTYLRPVGEASLQSARRRFHPDYRSTSVETGRLGSFFHTTPRDGFIRSIFTARPGHVLIQADFCLAPESRVLTTDLRWVPVKDVGVGDALVGFDEAISARHTKLRESRVLKRKTLTKPCVRITTDRGSVVCSIDHLWVRRQKHVHGGWVRADALKPGQAIAYFCDPWDVDTSWEGGYMAGFLDGEGWVGNANSNGSVSAGFGQNSGPTLDYVKGLLEARGFELGDRASKVSKVHSINPKGSRASLRMIGMFRPPRLIAKAHRLWDGISTWGRGTRPAIVESIEFLGNQEVIALETTTHTFIAEGMLSHNCQIEARLAAWAAAGRPTRNVPMGSMLEAWFHGRDVYSEQAGENLGIPTHQVSKDQRQEMGKVPVLSMLYNITPKGLREYAWREYEIEWTDTQAQVIHAGFYRRWPEFRRWHERLGVQIRRDGFVESAIGRRRRLPAAQFGKENGVNWYTVQQAVNSGINAPIQSIASDITQAAMIHWDRDYAALGGIVGNVHDALLFEVPLDRVHTSVERIVYVMLNAWKLLEPLGLRLPDGLIQLEVTKGPWGNQDKGGILYKEGVFSPDFLATRLEKISAGRA